MKKLVFLFVCLFVLVIGAKNVNAQANNYTISNAQASATIIQPIELSNTTALDFGNIIPDTNGGTVIMAADGTNSRTPNGVTLQPGVPGSAALFTVSGLAGASYSINLPTSDITLTNGKDNMTVGTFISSVGNASTIGTDGDSFYVGATLTIGANQSEGTYSGEYAVTVAYN